MNCRAIYFHTNTNYLSRRYFNLKQKKGRHSPVGIIPFAFFIIITLYCCEYNADGFENTTSIILKLYLTLW